MDEASPLLNADLPGYRVYKRRWIMLAILFLFSVSNNFLWLQYASISDIVASYYSIPTTTVDLLSSIYYIVYIIVIIPVMWLTNKHGLKIVLLFGTTSQCIGSWFRFFGTFVRLSGIYLNFIGQMLCGIGQACCFGMSSQMAGTWFAIDEVSLANGIGFIGVEVGIGLGLILPSLFVQDCRSVNQQMEYFFLYTAIVMSCIMILTVFAFESTPPLPPSRPKMNAINTEKTESYLQSMNVVLRNKHFILLLIAFALSSGFINTLQTLLNGWIKLTFSTSSELIRRAGILKIINGVLGPLTVGLWLDKSRKFRSTAVALSILLAGSVLGFSLSMEYKNEFLTTLSLGVSLFSFAALVIVGLELAVEITYPESEIISAGILIATGFTFSIIWLFIIDDVLSEVSLFFKTNCCFVVQLIPVLTTIFINGSNRRQNADQEYSLEDNVEMNEMQ